MCPPRAKAGQDRVDAVLSTRDVACRLLCSLPWVQKGKTFFKGKLAGLKLDPLWLQGSKVPLGMRAEIPKDSGP
uniref:Transposase n=1 Tax=Panagrellus redivivus TaxID=6233 RepID=A0A7E5A026_PANRE